MEHLGVEQIYTPHWQEHAFAPASVRPPEWEAARALACAGFSTLSRVTDASAALLEEHGGQVWVGRGFAFNRPVDRNLPAAFVSEELHKDHLSDVHKLLAAENVTSRHLWLWVELTEGFAMLRSFETEGLPEVGLDIDGIDGVWLGRTPPPARSPATYGLDSTAGPSSR
ncbi:hypothetical protein [Nocardioides okcheonensis]|uniref:hypothetical protein n=1 Tax=Nocardioides okcheonensis TaxID=2894081 RepID=UPI001E382E54|nr:hypothetical protein [Nocardioides okcheonensis]UFN44551.1 hypothetical protein LN652_21330 [Nocardioides okcheonensis]